jgi:hypothetical protein
MLHLLPIRSVPLCRGWARLHSADSTGTGAKASSAANDACRPAGRWSLTGMSGYELIADHGSIGNLQTAALINTDGWVD